MKRIILPTDFSDNAYNAIRYALRLFKDEKCTFYLLHTYTPAIYQAEYVLHSPSQIGLADVYRENSLTQLEVLKDEIGKEFGNPKHTVMIHTAFNVLVDEIVDTIANEKADLVIMGTQGATGAKEIFLGSQTVHVIMKSTCPVLAVPSNFKYVKPKKILFPTDFGVDYQKAQLRILMDIAEMHLSCIEVLHIASGYGLLVDQVEHKQKLEAFIVKTMNTYHELPNQSVIDAINKFKSDHKVDLLVMIQNKHTFLERMFIEPVIKKTAFHVDVPFLVIPSSVSRAADLQKKKG